MEVQFLSKDKKILYCNDDFLRVTVKNRQYLWKISDTGRARVVGDVLAIVDNAGIPIVDVRFKPDQEKRVHKVVELINSQNKDISVPDIIFERVQNYHEWKVVKKLVPVILVMLIAIFAIRGASPERQYRKDIVYNTKLLVNQHDQLTEELKKVNVFSSDWADAVMLEIGDIHIFVEECRKIEPPEKYKEDHKMYDAFLDEFEAAADALDTGMKTGKAEYGAKARAHFEKGLENMYQFLNMTDITL